jgi:xylan 1,4-beta-xylosidase
MGAFKLLGRLDGTRLPLTSSGARALDDIVTNSVRGEPDVDGIATRNGDAVQVLVWNYHDQIAATAAAPVHLAIEVPASFGRSARVSHLRVDESHGDAYTVWTSQGMPAGPSPAQIEALQEAMDPASLVPDRTVAVAADGSVVVDFDLPRFGISLVTITPAPDPGDAGIEIDGAEGGGGGGGCGCHAASRGRGASDPAALLGLGILMLVMIGRRRTGNRSM